MRINSFTLKSIFFAISISLLFSACETEDIKPALSANISNTELSEVAGSITFTATLNSVALQNINIPLIFSGTATKDTDYTASASSIIINKGQTTGIITIIGVEDGVVEGNEIIDIAIGNAPDVLILSNLSFSISLLDADFDTDGDGVTDANDQCIDIAGDPANNGCPFAGFVLNETLFDPANGLAGDANGDGVRDALQDEFVEFYNSSATAVDLSGYTLSDATQVRHTFPAGTIVPSNGVIVVFGGGTPTGTFGGAIVQTASTGLLNLNNAGDSVILKDLSNTVLVNFISTDYTNLDFGADNSITRNLDLYGDFVLHTTANSSLLYSPGLKIDGTSF